MVRAELIRTSTETPPVTTSTTLIDTKGSTRGIHETPVGPISIKDGYISWEFRELIVDLSATTLNDQLGVRTIGINKSKYTGSQMITSEINDEGVITARREIRLRDY